MARRRCLLAGAGRRGLRLRRKRLGSQQRGLLLSKELLLLEHLRLHHL